MKGFLWIARRLLRGVTSRSRPVIFTQGAIIEKIDDEWFRVNKAWLMQRYEEERLLLCGLEKRKLELEEWKKRFDVITQNASVPSTAHMFGKHNVLISIRL